MDYGKEAYSLVTELERRVGGGAAEFSAAVSVFGGVCLAGEVTEVADYAGGAALLTLSVTSSGAGGCDVLLGGVKVGSVATGGTFPFLFAAESGGKIALRPADGVIVTGVTAGAAGMNCAFAASEKPFAADAGGGAVYAAENADGLRLLRLTDGSFAGVAVFAEATDFDVAAFPGGALIAACDGKGNGVLYKISGGAPTASADVPDCLRIAAATTGEGFTVASCDGRKVTLTLFDSDLRPLAGTRVHGSPTVDKLALAKGGLFPTLAIGDGGKVLVRAWAAESRAVARLPLTAALTVEGGGDVR